MSSERNEQARATQVGIKSLKGNICRIQNPWPGKKNVTVLANNSKNKVKFQLGVDDVITFPTKVDDEYIIKSDERDSLAEPFVYSGIPTNKVKHLGKRVLGKLSGWNDFQD